MVPLPDGMTPSQVGERSEAAVMAALAGAGKHLLVPFGQRRYDLAYEEDGRLVKVQCKTGAERKGAIWFKTHSVIHGSRRDYRGDIDFFGVYCHERGEVYLVPVGDVPPTAAHLRVTPPLNNQKTKIRMAGPYLFKRGVDANILTNINISAKLQTMPTETTLTTLPVTCCAPLNAANISSPEAQATADLFKALADPHRVKILNLLANSDDAVCVCEINDEVGLSQPTISFHLKKLTSAGLLNREQRGTWAYFSIDPQAMKRLSSVVQLRRPEE